MQEGFDASPLDQGSRALDAHHRLATATDPRTGVGVRTHSGMAAQARSVAGWADSTAAITALRVPVRSSSVRVRSGDCSRSR